jgi:predicted nucleotidyltransferase
MLSPIGGTRDTIVNSLNINPVIDELCTKKNIIALILFGSVARGQSRQFSDIDLCIITRTDIAESERVDILSYGSGKIDVSLFHDLPLTIRFRILKEGKILFCNDYLYLHRITAATVREYLDCAPLIRRHCLHAIGIPG